MLEMRRGIQKANYDSSPGPSADGSFRKPESTASVHSISSTSSKFIPTSRRVYKVLKEYASKLVDPNIFAECLQDWVMENLHGNDEPHFSSPFPIDELRIFDFALEGILFQQLLRMPYPAYTSPNLKEDKFFALEDFLHTAAEGLWHAFWHKSKPLPYFVSCPRYPGSKFYTIEKAISRGRLGGLSGAALMSKNSHARWDDLVKFVLFKQNILKGNELEFSPSVICEALFYAVHILLSRSLIDLSNPYQSMAEWIRCHAEICISPVDQIWNKLGNVNWGDFGTLQVLLALFYSISQWSGPPRKSMASLAANHSLRLQKRRMENRPVENENAIVPYEQSSNHHGEIVEVALSNNRNPKRNGSHLKLNPGEILLLEDQNQGIRSFQIQDFIDDGNGCSYIACAGDSLSELLTLFVGAHPSRLEPSWEDMNLWYQVQRQTKVLNIFKTQGISSKYLPEIISSGRIAHSGPCEKQSPKGRCEHPWCGTPMLVTCPVGEPVSSIIAHDGPFSPEEATRCCRDCLAALSNAKKANILHGDICPENIIRIIDNQGSRNSFFLLVSWGRAVLEDRDSPALNLQFSSVHALEHGKLCPSSDVESLVYLIYFVSGGVMPQQDSIEAALKWRQRSWAKRVIQQHMGQVSPLLKAFADYVDSICGTPYAVDYDVWLKRLNRAVDSSVERGKMIEEVLRLKDVAESSGNSDGGISL